MFTQVCVFPDSPQGEIIQNQFTLPLPRISHREVVAMKVWIPQFITADHKAGMDTSVSSVINENVLQDL